MDIAHLKRRIEDLARHDKRLAIFGANAHGWRLRPIPPAEVEAFEARHALVLPADYRTWITEVGVGAGPFYGLEGLSGDAEDRRPGQVFPHEGPYEGAPLPVGVDARDGTVGLSDQGCGYHDLMVLRGPHAGEVWIDLRSAEGPVMPWYPSFFAWISAWLRRSEAEWMGDYMSDRAVEAEPAFLARCRAAARSVVEGPADPMCAQYPLPVDQLLQAEARLALADGDLAGAEAAFERAAAASPEPVGQQALGRCAVAAARGDHAARWAAATDGLAHPTLWWATRSKLLHEQIEALENLEQWDDAFAARITYAEHDARNLHARYDVAWIYLVRGQNAEAAAWLRRVAEEGLGCDPDAPLEARVAEVAAGLLPALESAGHTAEAEALTQALGLA